MLCYLITVNGNTNRYQLSGIAITAGNRKGKYSRKLFYLIEILLLRTIFISSATNLEKFVPRCALLSIRTMYQNIYVKLISIKAINENIFTKLSHARSEKQMPFLPFQMFVTLEGFAIFIFVIRFSNLAGALARFRDTLLLLCHLSNVAKKVTISSSPAPRSAVASPPSFSF